MFIVVYAFVSWSVLNWEWKWGLTNLINLVHEEPHWEILRIDYSLLQILNSTGTECIAWGSVQHKRGWFLVLGVYVLGKLRQILCRCPWLYGLAQYLSKQAFPSPWQFDKPKHNFGLTEFLTYLWLCVSLLVFLIPCGNHAQLRGGSAIERLMSTLAYGWVERYSDIVSCGQASS